MKQIGVLILAYLISHSLAFVLEYVYQTWCYPITLAGFFTSVFTQESRVCKMLRNAVSVLETNRLTL